MRRPYARADDSLRSNDGGPPGGFAQALQIVGERGGAVAMRRDQERVEDGEDLWATEDAEPLRDPRPAVDLVEADPPLGAVREQRRGHRDPHELIGVGGDDLAHAPPPEQASAVATPEPGARKRGGGATEP